MRQFFIGAIGGGAVMVLAVLGVQQETKQEPVVVQELVETPPLRTADALCQDPAFKVGHFPADSTGSDHFEARLTENPGQLNEVRYWLFWRSDPELAVIIEESRAGTAPVKRTDPNTEQFRRCIAGKKVEEVRPTR